MQWYYADGNRQAGPVDGDTFNSLVASGRITPETLVWSQDMANWQPYANVRAAIAAGTGAPPPPPPMGMRYCSECGRAFPPEDLAGFGNALVCAWCKPLFAQKLREGVFPSVHRYGGFWIRFLAVFIDGLILQVVSLFYSPFIIGFGFDPRDSMRSLVMTSLLVTISFAVQTAYETWFIGRFGATPGKMVCKLKVIRPDGRPVTYMRALGRVMAKFLNTFTLLIGYIIAAFDDEKRSLHDRICDTRVVRT